MIAANRFGLGARPGDLARLGEALLAVLDATGWDTHASQGGARGPLGTRLAALGGAVRGGRVLADWPGLARRELHEGRDLRPTLDLHAVLEGVLSEHLRVSDRALNETVFPDSGGVAALRGLVGA